MQPLSKHPHDRVPIPVEAAPAEDRQRPALLDAFIADASFPCIGAKSAIAHDGVWACHAGDLRSGGHDPEILAALRALPAGGRTPREFISLVALFPDTPGLSEVDFERHLWRRLQALHDADPSPWDAAVDADPRSPRFGMSLAGRAFYIVGMHPNSSRLARQAPTTMLAFNLHSQFDSLRQAGSFERFRSVIHSRDAALQGEANPMLADHGERSEALQYSGRQVAPDWACPFSARRPS